MKPEVPNEDQADMEHVATVLRLANERGDFVRMEDGYTAYWPTNEASRGALPSWALRVLADEMDRRDATWHAIISGDPQIGPGCVQVWKWDDAPEGLKEAHTEDGDEDWLALVPKTLVTHDEPEIWWMRWYPESQMAAKVRRYKDVEGVPNGFEIWVGVHA